MSNNDRLSVVVGQIVEEQLELTVGELCRAEPLLTTNASFWLFAK